MGAKHYKPIFALIFCIVVLQAGTALAKVNFRISVGSGGRYTPYGHRGFYRPYPYHGCYDSRYMWMDRGRYDWMDRDRYSGYIGISSYGHRRSHYSSGVSLYVSDIRPVYREVIYEPVVYKKPEPVNVPNQSYWVANTKSNEELFAELRLKKEDLLELIKSPEKELRAKAVEDLAGFSFDETVRQAMEKVLLSDPEPDLRKQAAKALGKVSNKQVLGALQQAKSNDPDASVRQEAFRSIILVKGY